MTALARLFGSLANTLLDLGLPRIRAWLRERVGPAADVAQVSTEGSFIQLDGVRLPIGDRGELMLDRATAAMTPARGGGADAASGALDAASPRLDGARVGPFVDAVQAMIGRALEGPPGVPLDAHLSGDLAWNARAGGKCNMHITAEGLDARVSGTV